MRTIARPYPPQGHRVNISLVNPPRPLILASNSSYRAELLRRLGLQFTQAAANIDEAAHAGETPPQLALRLARQKAAKLAERFPGATIIGSDQVASVADTILGKPLTAEAAAHQLRRCSGSQVRFFTAVSVTNPPPLTEQHHIDETLVEFRKLGDEEIDRYIANEPALDCAGGFKAEALGISLFDEIASRDPTGLIGLPLIWLSRALRKSGFALP